MNVQRRELSCEMRCTGDGRSIIGTIPYDSEADLGYFREVLKPGCFTESLNSGKKIVALWSHDSSKPLANTHNGTLTLRDTLEALHIKIDPNLKTTWGQDALEAAKRSDLGGFSFGFTVPDGGDYWQGDVRNVVNAELIEISSVTDPAYQKSTISVRGKHMNDNNVNVKTREVKEYFDEKGQRLHTRSEWEYLNEPINTPPEQEFRHAEVEDQPIYCGPYALGQQMVDIVAMSRPGSIAPEARSRWEQMVKREKTLAEKRAAGTGGMVQAVAQDGGLLLQGETSMDMQTSGFNNSAVLSRASRRNIGQNQYVDLIGVDETARTDGSRGGGVRVYTSAELEQLTQSKPKLTKTRLEPHKLTGLYYSSNELVGNAPILTAEMTTLFTDEFAFKGQDLAINGTGAGEALGIMNAGCLITVTKETGQVADTVVFENLVKMKARIQIRNRKSLLWIANQEVEAQLFQLSLPVGTGGSGMPVYIPSENQSSGVAGSLLGAPIVFVEQCAALGDLGDIILGDWSSYLAADKGDVQMASSIHLKFDYDQTTFRFVTHFDGQPRLKSAVTPYKGNDTVSPFVALAARA